MQASGLHHVSILVTDNDAAKRFYGDVLGLREVSRPAFRFRGAWYELDDGSQIHLIESTHGKTLRHTQQIDSGDGHYALRVADFDAAVERLQAAGVEVSVRRENLTPWMQAYCVDPSGNVIELNAPRTERSS